MNKATLEVTGYTQESPSDLGCARTAFLATPGHSHMAAVRKALKARGVFSFSPDELNFAGQSLSVALREAMRRADMVIGVIDDSPASANVLYELGFAEALEKPTLLLVIGDVAVSTWLPGGVPRLRFDPSDPSGMELGISQFLEAFHQRGLSDSSSFRRTNPLGPAAESLLSELRTLPDDDWQGLEQLVERAIKLSGAIHLVEGGGKESQIDLACWVDDLGPWIQNPVLIEVKTKMKSVEEVDRVVARLERAMSGIEMGWGLIVYRGADIDMATAVKATKILHISLEDFLTRLRDASFSELLRRLRNQRIHGTA